jgi:hypothetical protein
MVIDRIEGEIAVIEHDGHTFDLPVSVLPDGSREGSELSLVLTPSDLTQDADARLARLRARDTNPDHIDL